MGNLDIIHVLGNHEFYGDESGDIATDIFNLPDRNKKYYSVEYGIVYVGVINYISGRDLQEALEWVVADAAKSNAKWRILVTHQPPYYTNPQGGNDVFNELVPIYAEMGGFDFVFSGHDHAYARTKPLLNGLPNNNGIVYINVGAVGEKRYDFVNNPDFHFEVLYDTFNSIYLSIEATENKFVINAFDTVEGVTLDSYTKTKNVDHEHNYYIDGDRLICSDCYYNIPVRIFWICNW